jgi:sRNA-binding carbon storage regulator CsrA
VLCTAEYDVSAQEGSSGADGVRPEDAALVPVAKPTLKSVTSGAYSKAHDFTRENDFQLLLPEVEEIDVNDPDNDHLLYIKSKRLAGDDGDVFRLAGNDFGTVFCGEDGHPFSNYVRYKETPRMKLLQLRCVKPYLFNAPIPINEDIIKRSELYKAIFQKEVHEKMARVGSADHDDHGGDDKLTSGTVSVNAAKVSSFLQRVRNSQTAMSRRKKKKHYVTSSVVVETDYITLEELEFVDLLERKRSLRPKVKVRAPVSVQVDRCELLVQIVGAKNVPLRSEFDGLATLAAGTGAGAGAGVGAGAGLGASSSRRRPRSSSGAGGPGGEEDAPIVSEHMLDERKVRERRRARTFVEIKFQENTIATVAMDGGTPMWRESLSLPFRPPQDDFTPSSLEQVREEVYFTLFDEVVEDDSNRGGEKCY